MLPAYALVRNALAARAAEWAGVSMLARTHGQPASPTRLGKEIEVFVARLDAQVALLAQVPFGAKFGGATGNFNAHHAAYPDIDWHAFAQTFVNERLGLHRSFPTTQIEHYDHLAAHCDGLKRLNTILLDLARDVWQYISLGYFRQTIKAGEVGSSAMPHKVNPIDFENAEGNLGVANALLEHFAAKLPISRLQRDLTDSTVLRNLGVPLGHTLIALGCPAARPGQAGPRRSRPGPRPRRQLGRAGRAHPDHPAPRGLPRPLQRPQGPHPHRRGHFGGQHRGLY